MILKIVESKQTQGMLGEAGKQIFAKILEVMENEANSEDGVQIVPKGKMLFFDELKACLNERWQIENVSGLGNTEDGDFPFFIKVEPKSDVMEIKSPKGKSDLTKAMIDSKSLLEELQKAINETNKPKNKSESSCNGCGSDCKNSCDGNSLDGVTTKAHKKSAEQQRQALSDSKPFIFASRLDGKLYKVGSKEFTDWALSKSDIISRDQARDFIFHAIENEAGRQAGDFVMLVHDDFDKHLGFQSALGLMVQMQQQGLNFNDEAARDKFIDEVSRASGLQSRQILHNNEILDLLIMDVSKMVTIKK